MKPLQSALQKLRLKRDSLWSARLTIPEYFALVDSGFEIRPQSVNGWPTREQQIAGLSEPRWYDVIVTAEQATQHNLMPNGPAKWKRVKPKAL